MASFRQVLTFGCDGTISGIDYKEKGINIKSLGKASMVRATDILWHEDNNSKGYYISFLSGPRKETCLLAEEAKYLPFEYEVSNEGLALYSTYDLCIKVEIFVLDKDRLQGIF